jgi:hypothetical protein
MTQNRINTKQPLVQYVNTSTNSIILLNSAFIRDDSKPQKTEGVEVLTATITPTNANNILIIRANAYGEAVAGTYMGIGLFQDAADDALAVSSYYSHAAGWGAKGILSWSMTAGTTSATTFKIRCGRYSTASIYLNGNNAGASLYNGTYLSFLEIYEIKA